MSAIEGFWVSVVVQVFMANKVKSYNLTDCHYVPGGF